MVAFGGIRTKRRKKQETFEITAQESVGFQNGMQAKVKWHDYWVQGLLIYEFGFLFSDFFFKIQFSSTKVDIFRVEFQEHCSI